MVKSQTTATYNWYTGGTDTSGMMLYA